ncbi:MAG: bifunctional diaminohydroxyphosphoribosylaminopyrimidine deaminase/5-amino-6-(5-phosphoribosylamino)uracil reductase RibD [Burkholderiales bacterium]|nr:bifunctional diaminohydroxyphosphoribosylaminopyrimidine deaminase/5-amino-6-(5-phosphoribosylamino)uracil reductase RibD [Burkholderiales bacterium]
MTDWTRDDHRYMAQALRLAARGLFTTTPNPRVGCVLVKGGEVVGEGWHVRAGGPHAEVAAIAASTVPVRGATAYVTLEPCSHTGRTPPCTDALIAAGIAEVVYAMPDPNPEVAGGGAAALQAAGVGVRAGLMAEAAAALNRGFISRMTRGRPWLRLKVAATLDGRTALADGDSRWITGKPARTDVHRLRAQACAVMTGIGTLLADDPLLNVRHVDTERQPLRVVVDNNLAFPTHAATLREPGGVLVATASSDDDRIEAVRAAGAEVLQLNTARGRVDLSRLLKSLGERGLNEVLVEAGQNLNGALIGKGLVDELIVYLNARVMGSSGRGMFALTALETMEHAPGFVIADVRMLGPDLRVTLHPREAPRV